MVKTLNVIYRQWALVQRYDPSGPLTLEQHIYRATVLGNEPYARDGRQCYW